MLFIPIFIVCQAFCSRDIRWNFVDTILQRLQLMYLYRPFNLLHKYCNISINPSLSKWVITTLQLEETGMLSYSKTLKMTQFLFLYNVVHSWTLQSMNKKRTFLLLVSKFLLEAPVDQSLSPVISLTPLSS